MPYRKPCVHESSWIEKETASEIRRRRPAFEVATSVWHTSQSVCATNQEPHRERLEAGAISVTKRSGRERRDDWVVVLGFGIGKHASEVHSTDEKTRAERSACIVPQSRAPRRQPGLGGPLLDFLDGLGEEGAGMSVEMASSSSASQMLFALG